MNINFFVVFILSFLFPPFLFAQTVYQAHTQVELISDVKSVQPGSPFWVGLRMRMDEDWHVYWKNPGDSGLAPSIEWKLPEGFSAGEIHWPYPVRINAGPLTSFGYEKEVILWSQIFPPKGFLELETANILANVEWLACRVDCIPGKAELTLSLPISQGPSERNIEGDAALQKSYWLWPINSNRWTVEAINYLNTIILEFWAPDVQPYLRDVVFYPEDDRLIEHAATQELKIAPPGYRLFLRKSHLMTQVPAYVGGILVQGEGWGWDEQGRQRALKIKVPVKSPEQSLFHRNVPGNSLTLWLACLFAFLGGIILNFMPCVLPVLSLKVLGLIKSAGNRRRILISGFLFATGVVVSFWVLAGILIALQSAGHQLGWGFQFQSPVFVVAIALVLFILALNLFGVFEIGFALNLKTGVPSTGYLGSFLSGILATVVATPCTAPFMGAAIGFALSQPPVVALLIFTCLGLGMVSPFLLLCIFPGALRFIPKPGKWMYALKAVLGILLLACVVWLVWVLGLQKGFWTDLSNPTTQNLNVKNNKIAWQEFSSELLMQLRAQGEPVFIDFTAAWCLTCQVNDRLVFQNNKVARTFQELGVTALKADWTNHSETISQALAGYGKNSIPLYVLYGNQQAAPVILPELVTPDLVVNALRQNIKRD